MPKHKDFLSLWYISLIHMFFFANPNGYVLVWVELFATWSKRDGWGSTCFGSLKSCCFCTASKKIVNRQSNLPFPESEKEDLWRRPCGRNPQRWVFSVYWNETIRDAPGENSWVLVLPALSPSLPLNSAIGRIPVFVPYWCYHLFLLLN